MDNIQVNLLSKEQIEGTGALESLLDIGTECAFTDYAILLDGFISSDHLEDDNTLKGRTGFWWTKSSYDGKAMAVNTRGAILYSAVDQRTIGIRPVIKISDIINFQTRKIIKKDTHSEYLYGEYPQYAVNKNIAELLNNELEEGNLIETGKIYTADTWQWDSYSKKFKPRSLKEYALDGKKYVKVPYIDSDTCHLSNDGEYMTDDEIWVEVEPITWIIDEKANILISKQCLVAGIRLNEKATYNGKFEETEMYNYLNTYFNKEMMTSDVLEERKGILNQFNLINNPYSLEYKDASEEEIIRSTIECGIPLFLHGQSSEGKSSRVKQIDPDCIILYLRNTTPEGLNGKCIYDQTTGKIIDVKPTWLEKLEEKCKNEPDKLHILFFDEITNALPSIQGMAFNIVLDKEVNGKWKLPENARIVAAGNDMKDSLAANKLAEPLFNRFAHVYIETTLVKWLKWAAENHIHPAIMSYIAYKGESVLRTHYNGERPNADPRKWEMASKMLYQTRQPKMLKVLVGEDIARDFTRFCQSKTITIESVLSENFDRAMISKLDVSERYATVTGLSKVDEQNVETIRDVVKEMGNEFLWLFDALWTNGNEQRLEKIAELKLLEKQIG